MSQKLALIVTLFFAFVSFAFAQSHAIVALKRQDGEGSNTDQAAAPNTTTSANPSATVDADELVESAQINLDGQIFPPSIQVAGVSSTNLLDFTINCVDCSVNSNFSLSAGKSSLGFATPSDVEQKGDSSGFDFSDIWVAATVDSFDATMEIAFNLTASNTTNGFNIPLYTQSQTLQENFLTLTATLTTALHGWVNSTNDVNFTYGFNFTIPPFSEVLIDISNPENSTTLGFNETTLTPIPFSASRSDFQAAVEIGIRPSISFVVSIGNGILSGSVALSVGLDIPKLEFDIASVHNVTSSCEPAGASIPADQIYDILTLITPSLGFDVFEVFEEKAGGLGAQISAQQPFMQNFTRNLTNHCLYLDPVKKSMSPATVSKPKHASISAAGGRQVPFASVFTSILVVAGIVAFL